MINTATLKITNCLDCPNHKLVPSVIFDSWDYADEDLICTASSGQHKYRHGDTIEGRVVFMMERYRHRELAKVPNWCPLLKDDKK